MLCKWARKMRRLQSDRARWAWFRAQFAARGIDRAEGYGIRGIYRGMVAAHGIAAAELKGTASESRAYELAELAAGMLRREDRKPA